MTTTNVPAITWNNGEPVIPTEQAVLAGRNADFTQAFGGGINMAPTTPQGQIAASDTAIIGDKNAQIALVASMVDPDQSEGAWQDYIGAIYFLERIAAAGSVVTCTCIGAVNTTVVAGSQFKDPSGYLWAATGDIDIGSSGQATGTFQCMTQGPIALAGNTQCTIYTSIVGWDRVVTTADAALGRYVESRAQFENRRRQSVAINSHGTTQTIKGNLLDIVGVLSAYVIDNPTNAAVTVGSTNYSVAAHSILASVYGGASADIANAIWTGKDGGCAYNGNTSATVYDTSYPAGSQPAYTITWLTPTPTPVYFAITIQNTTSLPPDVAASIQTAVLETFNGTDAAGSVPAGIGLTISGTRYSTGINAVSSAINIVSINVGLQTAVTGESVGTGDGTTVTFTHTAAHLSVVPGTVTITAGSVTATDDGAGNLTGTGIASGSTVNYATGAVSITYSTAPANSTAITMAYSYANPTSGILTMGVDQMPTLTADAVVVTFQ